MSDIVEKMKLKTDENGYTICPQCDGQRWRAVKEPRLGPGVYEVRCDRCNGMGWMGQEDPVRP